MIVYHSLAIQPYLWQTILSFDDLSRIIIKDEKWHKSEKEPAKMGKNGNLKPNLVTARSHKKVWWICSNDHEWEAPVNNRTGGRGCPVCYKEKRKIKT